METKKIQTWLINKDRTIKLGVIGTPEQAQYIQQTLLASLPYTISRDSIEVIAPTIQEVSAEHLIEGASRLEQKQGQRVLWLVCSIANIPSTLIWPLRLVFISDYVTNEDLRSLPAQFVPVSISIADLCATLGEEIKEVSAIHIAAMEVAKIQHERAKIEQQTKDFEKKEETQETCIASTVKKALVPYIAKLWFYRIISLFLLCIVTLCSFSLLTAIQYPQHTKVLLEKCQGYIPWIQTVTVEKTIPQEEQERQEDTSIPKEHISTLHQGENQPSTSNADFTHEQSVHEREDN